MNWGDREKRIIVEDIVTYAAILLISVFLDYLLVLSIKVGLNKELLHPYSFGKWQVLGAVISIIQLIRRTIDWHWYR